MSDTSRPDPPWFLPAAMTNRAEEREKQVLFADPPSQDDLALPMGWGEVASSSNEAVDDRREFRISVGQQPPIWFAKVSLGIAIVGGMICMALFWPPGKLKWGSIIGIAVVGAVISSQFIAVLRWLNAMHGTDDYLVFDKVSGEVRLPRLDLTLPSNSIEKLVSIQFADQLKQVCLLASNHTAATPKDRWLYAWVYNPLQWKEREIDRLAQALGVEVEYIKLSKADTKRAFE